MDAVGNIIGNMFKFELATLVVTIIGAILITILAWRLYREFGWVIYRKLGGDVQISNMYRIYQITFICLKFDMFVFMAFSFQRIMLMPKKSNIIYRFHTIGATLLSVIVVGLAMYAVSKQHQLYCNLSD
jgi:hypothetical protein